MVDDGHPVAEAIRLLHVVGGEQHRSAAGAESGDDLPDLAPRLRIEPGGGLVQEQNLGVPHQGAGQGEALLLASRKLPDPGARLLLQLDQAQRFLGGAPGPEEAPEEEEHLPHRQLLGKLGLLELDSDPLPNLTLPLVPCEPQDLHFPRFRGEKPLEDLHGRGLAGAVGAEKAEAFSPAHLETDAGKGDDVFVPLDEIPAAQGDVGHAQFPGASRNW